METDLLQSAIEHLATKWVDGIGSSAGGVAEKILVDLYNYAKTKLAGKEELPDFEALSQIPRDSLLQYIREIAEVDSEFSAAIKGYYRNGAEAALVNNLTMTARDNSEIKVINANNVQKIEM